MRTFDLSPLFRSTIGFDHLTQALDTAFQASETSLTYPPYNIEKTGEDAYRITMAVAGFSAEELEVITHEGTLSVRGRAKTESENGQTVYLYHGIAARAFERRFQLADYVHVIGARLENGMLFLDLARQVPEALKPRAIAINPGPANAGATQLTSKAA